MVGALGGGEACFWRGWSKLDTIRKDGIQVLSISCCRVTLFLPHLIPEPHLLHISVLKFSSQVIVMHTPQNLSQKAGPVAMTVLEDPSPNLPLLTVQVVSGLSVCLGACKYDCGISDTVPALTESCSCWRCWHKQSRVPGKVAWEPCGGYNQIRPV